MAVQFSFAISLYHRFQKRARAKLSLLTAAIVAIVATVALSVGGDDGDDEIRGVKAPSPSSPIVTGESCFTTSLIGVYRFGPVDKITHSRDAYGILEEKQRR